MSKKLLATLTAIHIFILVFAFSNLSGDVGGWDLMLLWLGLAGGSILNLIVMLLMCFINIKVKSIFIFYSIGMLISGILIITGIGFILLPIFAIGFSLYTSIYFIMVEEYALASNFIMGVLVTIQLLHINYAFMPELCMTLLPILVVVFIVQLIPFIKEMRDG